MTAVAYVDPGNFATNIAAGSGYGYLLVWVVVVSNIMAMLIQYLSAKAGVATGLSLPALCREHLPRPVVKGLWGQAELVAIATDLAEVVGGALALKLLFDLPLLVGGTITAVVAFALLAVKGAGHRHFETVIIGLLGVILVGFVYDIAISGVDAMAVLDGTLPRFDGSTASCSPPACSARRSCPTRSTSTARSPASGCTPAPTRRGARSCAASASTWSRP